MISIVRIKDELGIGSKRLVEWGKKTSGVWYVYNYCYY